MKRILVLFMVLFFASLLSYAQDIIVKKDGTNIRSIINEVSDSEIVYKLFDNSEGPVYRVSKTNVAKIIFSNGYIEEINSVENNQSAYAPVYVTTGVIDVFKGRLLHNGHKLSEGEIQRVFGEDVLKQYRQITKKRRGGIAGIAVGSSLIAGGVSMLGVGASRVQSSWDYDYDYYDDGGYEGSVALTVVGCLCIAGGSCGLGVGLSKYLKSEKSLEKISSDYNLKHYYAKISFDMTPAGFGVALNF